MIALVNRPRVLAPAGREGAVAVSLPDETGHLVEGEPTLDPVPQPADHSLGIVAERVHRDPCQPAAPVLERLRQVPVEKRHPGCDPACQQRVDQPIVEVEPERVDRAIPLGEDSRPGDRQAIVTDPEVLHQGGVVLEAVVVVACHLGRLAGLDGTRPSGEAVPDRFALAVLARRPLDLRRRRGHSPDEPFGESVGCLTHRFDARSIEVIRESLPRKDFGLPPAPTGGSRRPSPVVNLPFPVAICKDSQDGSGGRHNTPQGRD